MLREGDSELDGCKLDVEGEDYLYVRVNQILACLDNV